MSVGTDIVEVERIKNAILRTEMAFLKRVFTDEEIAQIGVEYPDYERASGFWAAKESIVKATGLGFRNGVCFHDAEISHDENGAPYFKLHGRLKEVIPEKGFTNITLSISHCRLYAIAVTILT
ncbi:holo-ACP synthase [Pantoea phytobeneficialis]|uniref:Holo-[acyl-carrier-protein] synthase n=1 Tax=Pantoea phytobeneficialis TaxID=2052056 RepID=A0AAP9H4Q2_9GAMM|nr:holo-ACP synthase [Pantoea phytobeneficialis]MDO6406143.1 holo-ACP synthase [Pantoea phytobeneficialis]QGR06546.1 holo-[acyl-carrier-protein] synthase [Pantoea phytobeneficialis]